MRPKPQVWALFFVLSMVGTAVAVGTYEATRDENAFRLPLFADHTQVAYDLVMLRPPNPPFRVADFLTIEIDGAVPLETPRGAIEGLHHVHWRERWGQLPYPAPGPDVAAYWEGDMQQEFWIDAPAGEIVRQSTERRYLHGVPGDDGVTLEWTVRTERRESWERSVGSHPLLTLPAGRLLQWNAATPEYLDLLAQVAGLGRGPWGASERGTLDGRNVLALDDFHYLRFGQEPSVGGRIGGCGIFTYRMQLGAVGLGNESWTRGHTWFEPSSPFPLRVDCAAGEGDRLGISLALTRARLSEEGERRSLVTKPNWETSLFPRGVGAAAFEGQVPELGTLRFPLSEAMEALRRNESLEGLHEFLRDSRAVVAYWGDLRHREEELQRPGPSPPPSDPVDRAERIISDATGGDDESNATRVVAWWNLEFQNETGNRTSGTALREYAAGRQVSSEERGSTLISEGTPPALDALPAALHPLESVVDWAREDKALEFAEAPGWSVGFRVLAHLDADQPDLRPYVGYRLSHAADDGTARWNEEHEWDATNGVLTYSSWTEERPSSPPPLAGAPAAPPPPVPTMRFSSAVGAGVGTAALAFATVYLWGPAKAAGIALLYYPLYAKIAKDKVLRHSRRDDILALVGANPGIPIVGVKRSLGFGWGATVHHLVTLERNGFVTSVRVGRSRCFFLPGQVDASTKPSVALARQEAAARLLEFVRSNPGLTQGALAERARLTPGTVSVHVRRLARAGLLRLERAGRENRLFPVGDGAPPSTSLDAA